MRVKYVLVMVMISVLLCGCQPNPKEEAVINKADNKLQQTIQATPQTSDENQWVKALSEDNWVEEYTLPMLDCQIDARIVLANQDVFPVYKIKRREFDNEFVSNLIQHIVLGATGVRDSSDTKEELEQLLIQVKRGAYVVNDNGGKWEPYEGQEQEISDLEEQIESVKPETFSPINSSNIILPIDKTYQMPDGTRSFITAEKESFRFYKDKYGILQPERWLANYAGPNQPEGTTLENVIISQDVAGRTAENFILDLGIVNFGCAYSEKARILNDLTGETVSEGWLVYYARNDGGYLPVNFESLELNGLLDFYTEDYVERWWPETISIYVDQNGIRSFNWSSPLQVVEEMNSDVKLMPFETIKERIRKTIKFGYSQSVDSGTIAGQNYLSIDKIILSDIMVPIIDDLEHQMLQPVWLVFYHDYCFYNDVKIEGSNSVFAINAIDGSNVDLAMRTHGNE